MRRLLVVAVTATALLALSLPSSAAPDRSVTLSRKHRAVAWGSDFGVGFFGPLPPAYEAVRCTDLSRCDYTLIQLTDKGSISLDVTPRADAGYPPVMHTSLYRSDIDGAIGSPVPTASSGKPSPNSVRTARLAAGYYLAEVEWIEGAGSYYALAQLTP